jgi:hypothetical protein
MRCTLTMSGCKDRASIHSTGLGVTDHHRRRETYRWYGTEELNSGVTIHVPEPLRPEKWP